MKQRINMLDELSHIPEEYVHEKGDMTEVHNPDFQEELRKAGEEVVEKSEDNLELESLPELRERVARSEIAYSLLPFTKHNLSGNENFVIMTPQHLVEILSNPNHLIQMREKIDGDPRRAYEAQPNFLNNLENLVFSQKGASEQWNRFWNYDKIIIALLSCLDKEGQIEQKINDYEKQLYELAGPSHQFKFISDKCSMAIEGLIEQIKGAELLKDKDVLEIGGSALQELSKLNISGNANCTTISSQINEHGNFPAPDSMIDVDSHLTTENYQQRFGDKQFDVTVTRFVFELGSGVGYSQPGKDERRGGKDLLDVLSKLTKKGGFSIHEGHEADFDDELLATLGFEKVLTIELTRQVMDYEQRHYGTEVLKKIVEGRGQIPEEERGIIERKSESVLSSYSNNSNNGGRICILRKITD